MMKQINNLLYRNIFKALFAFSVLFSSCTVKVNDEDCLKGEEAVETSERDMTDFEMLDISGMQQVYLKQGESYAVKIEAPSDLMPHIKTSVEGGTLKVWNEPCLADPEQIQIHITLPTLNSIKASGIGTIETVGTFEGDIIELEAQGATAIKMDINANALKVNIPGATTMEFTGGCELLEVNATGAATIDAKGLRASNVKVTMSGATTCSVHPIDHLDATINGMGIVEYYGNPEVKQEVNGLGTVKKMEEEEQPEV